MSLQLGEVRQDEGGGGRSRLAHCCPGDEGVQVVLTGRGEVQTTGGQDEECKLRYHSLLMNTIPNTKTFFVPFPSLRCCMQVVRVYTYEIQNWTVDPAAEPLHCSSRVERGVWPRKRRIQESFYSCCCIIMPALNYPDWKRHC